MSGEHDLSSATARERGAIADSRVVDNSGDHRSLDPCWVCGEVPTMVLEGRLPTCPDHLHSEQPRHLDGPTPDEPCGLCGPSHDDYTHDKVGDCWHCGGYVSSDDEHVLVGSLVYHRGCAQRLRDDLEEALHP